VLSRILGWLKAKLTNSWMNNANYLAAMAHSGWAGLILGIVVLFTIPGLPDLKLVGAFTGLLLIGWAAPKEFIYDANYEVPEQTFADNMSDFLEYVVGAAIVWAAIGIKALLIAHGAAT